MILAGTQSQHQKEDSLIDLNEESSYMKQSQPMPDQLRQNSRSKLQHPHVDNDGSETCPPVYMNTDQQQEQTGTSYQRLPLQVSDRPTTAVQPVVQESSENSSNHQRMPSDSSILDEPIDVPTQPDSNDFRYIIST